MLLKLYFSENKFMWLYQRRWFIVCIFFAIALFSSHLCAKTSSYKIDSFKQAIKNATTDTEKVNDLISLSKMYSCKDSIEKIKAANEALQLAENTQWKKGMIYANLTLGRLYVNCIQNFTESIKYFQQGVSIAMACGDIANEALGLVYIAGAYGELEQYAKKIDCYREVLRLKISPDLKFGTLGNIGGTYATVGNYTVALAYYDSALLVLDALIKTEKKNSRDYILSNALLKITIGDIYLAMGEYDHALGNYNTALELFEQTQNEYGTILSFTGMGKAYQAQKNDEQAIAFYNKALEKCKKEGDKQEDEEDETIIYNQLGKLYLENGALNKALQYGQSSLDLIEGFPYNKQLPVSYTLMGEIDTRLRQYNKAVQYLNKAINLCKRSGALDNEKDALQALSVAYEQMNKRGEAFEAYKQYITLRDSIYSQSKAREMTRIEMQGDFDRKQLNDRLEQEKKDRATERHLNHQRVLIYGGFGAFALVLLLSFFIYRNYSQQKKANKTISQQKQVSESLLLNILPADVADELKTRGKVKARRFDNVSVLFTDFVNFTAAGERMSPEDLVAELHTCFEAFDNIMGKYKIEKIKTVGDAYVAVSGLPNANPDHAGDMIRAAIEIRDFINERKRENGAAAFGVRIGINSGKLVAGIVGVKKFAYDIWGDTVNTAARMEQTGEEGKINISQATWELAKDEFVCSYRGEIEAKNKGKLKMYFVVSPNPGAAIT